jgi:hypothetical protein
VATDEQLDEEAISEKIINEGRRSFRSGLKSNLLTSGEHLRLEYKTWKKNAPFLYDLVLR